MKIRCEVQGDRVIYRYTPEHTDVRRIGRARMVARRVTVKLPQPIARPHADLLALAGFLIVAPFVGPTLTFAWRVSERLRSLLATYGVSEPRRVEAKDFLPPRVRPDAGRPGLAFSGGVDSLAAAALLPEALLVHVQRARLIGGVFHPAAKSEGGRVAVEAMRARGWEAFSCPSDHEFVRRPPGFADHMACAVPLILLADAYRLNASVYGTVAEAAYRFGTDRYVEAGSRGALTRIFDLFEAVGLPCIMPFLGVSEVGTHTVLRASGLEPLASSCSHGAAKACGVCQKCFRKGVTQAALGDPWPSPDRVDAILKDPQVREHLAAAPIRLENVFSFAMARYDGADPRLLALKRRVRGGEVDLDWMRRLIPGSLDHVPGDYRPRLEAALRDHLGEMSLQDVSAMRAWSSRSFIESPDGRLRHQAFVAEVGL